MKIKLLEAAGSNPYGSIVEAIKNPMSQHAIFFDNSGISYSVFNFEEISTAEPTAVINNMRSLFGQDVKTIEFK